MHRLSLRKYFSGLSRNTYLLTIGSLFADISTEMLYPILPIYLTQILKVGGSAIGIIEGVATATQNVIQGFSGWLSDKIQRRKPIAIVGYTLAALSKPLIGATTSWSGVLGARFADRLGAGMRSAPRDALVAQSADELNRGKAFGLEGVGDNLGAFLGPLVTIVLMYTFSVSMRWIFYLAIVPGALSVVMILLVKESPFPKAVHSKITIALNKLPGAYWKYLAITAVFGLGNSSNAFLILRTKDLGIPLFGTIGMYAVFNLIAALASYPSGFLSDKFGRKNILLGSFFIYFVVYVGFALSQNALFIAILFALYGMFQGAYRTVGKAFASDFVPQHLRASSIGWYSTTVGLSGLFASIVAGLVWDSIGHSAVFFLGSGFALLGCITLLLFVFEATTRPAD